MCGVAVIAPEVCSLCTDLEVQGKGKRQGRQRSALCPVAAMSDKQLALSRAQGTEPPWWAVPRPPQATAMFPDSSSRLSG